MRVLFLLLAIVALALAWTGGWHYVAGLVSAQLDKLVERLEKKQKTVACDNREITGYPFRIGFSCTGFRYVDGENNHHYSARLLRSASQIYQPGKIVIEFEPPGDFKLGEFGFDTNWQSLRASVTANLDGPQRFSFHGRDLELLEKFATADSVRISDLQIHGRKNGETDVDYALSATGVSSGSNRWTGFSASMTLKLEDAYEKLLEETDLRKVGRRYGLAGHVDKLIYNADNGGSLTITGPFSASREGNLSGKFDVGITDAAALADALKEVLPEYQNEITLFSAALGYAGFGAAGTISLPVSVNEGKAAIGFIPFADLPPVY